jgi:hypothetical protein
VLTPITQPNALAERTFKAIRKAATEHIKEAVRRLRLRSTVTVPSLRASTRPLTEAENKCVATYDRLFAAGPLEIRIVLGYDDIDDTDKVEDTATEAVLSSMLSSPCPARNPELRICGFSPGVTQGDWTRTLPGPDGVPREVVIRIRSSSASVSDAYNRGDGRTLQLQRSADALAFFLEGLAQADAVIYLGHSRDGGGPSFEPPRRVHERQGYSCERLRGDARARCAWKGNQVDYDWYHAERPGRRAMLQALSTASNRTRFLALASCYSANHFLADLRATAPELGVYASRSAYIDRTMRWAPVIALDNLLSMRCRADFVRPAVEGSIVNPDTGRRQDGNPTLDGFF